MPTIYSHEEVALRARLALNVQECAVRSSEGGHVIVFEDSETIWLDWKDLGSWHSVRSSLQRFGRAESFPEHRHCIVLSESSPAQPLLALTDRSALSSTYMHYDGIE